MTKDRIRWGILGAANIARTMVMPGMQEAQGAVIQAVASRDAARAQELAAAFAVPVVHSSYEALLKDPDIDAVYIPLPNHLHRPWTIKAAEAGKHVLCEKPLAITAAECDAMIEACQKHGVLLMEGYMYSLHPQITTVMELLEKHSIGQVTLVRGSFSFPMEPGENIRLEPEYGGGSLMDVGCYPIHLANLIYRQAPETVQAAAIWEGGVDITAAGVLRYAGHRLAVIDSSFAMWDRQEVEIVGTAGRIRLTRPWRADDLETDVMVESPEGSETYKIAASNPYKLEIEHFQDCMVHRRQPLPSPEKGRDVVRVIEALFEAARTGRELELEE